MEAVEGRELESLSLFSPTITAGCRVRRSSATVDRVCHQPVPELSTLYHRTRVLTLIITYRHYTDHFRYMEVDQPVWVLDRRDSGHLFWRRDHSVLDRRVKFRYDVEVLEFWRSDEERQQMLCPAGSQWLMETAPGEKEIQHGCRAVEEMPPPSSLAAAFCLCVIVATLSYNWLMSAAL
ncbi:uncharacterized protein [Rhodnius prolixus]